mgnify:CR=1 FL=1
MIDLIRLRCLGAVVSRTLGGKLLRFEVYLGLGDTQGVFTTDWLQFQLGLILKIMLL